MDFCLTGEQELLVSTIRRFTTQKLRSLAADADRAGEAPALLFSLGAELGFFADAVSERYGGLLEGEYSHLNRALRGLELGRGCAGLSSHLEANVEGALALQRWGSASLCERLLPGLAAGETLSLAHDFHGHLEFNSSESPTISGTLGPIPGGGRASALLVLAKNREGHGLIALVPRSLAEVQTMTPSGWRAGSWATWSFASATLLADDVLAAGQDTESIQDEILSWARVSIAARALGVASAAIEYAEAYGQDRVQFGQAIGDFESIIRLRDQNETAIRAARLLVLEAASLLERGDASAGDVASRARDFAAQVVTRATIDAVQIFGGYGFVNDYPVEKLMRDARAFDVLHGNEAFSRVLTRRRKA